MLFYRAGAQYVTALLALFSKVHSHNKSLFASSAFDSSLEFEKNFLKVFKNQDHNFGCLRKQDEFVSVGPRRAHGVV